MGSGEVSIRRGLPDATEARAAALYEEAFGAKFAVAVRSDAQRIALLERSLCPAFSVAAVVGDELVGVAGFHTPEGSFTGAMTYRGLVALLGFLRGTWAALIFSLYERKPTPGELLMDGIAVDARFRGRGIGGELLDAVAACARERGCSRVRLDVIDVNPRARSLYEKKGFRAVGTQRFPYLKWLLGFGASTTMELELPSADSARSQER